MGAGGGGAVSSLFPEHFAWSYLRTHVEVKQQNGPCLLLESMYSISKQRQCERLPSSNFQQTPPHPPSMSSNATSITVNINPKSTAAFFSCFTVRWNTPPNITSAHKLAAKPRDAGYAIPAAKAMSPNGTKRVDASSGARSSW